MDSQTTMTTAAATSAPSLDAHGIFAVVVFVIVALICIQPVSLPLPYAISTPLRRLAALVWPPPHPEGSQGGSLATPSASGPTQQQPKSSDVRRDDDDERAVGLPPPSTASVAEELPSTPPPPRLRLRLDHVWTPALGVLLLLVTLTIGGNEVRLGIVGSDGVEPYDVLIFFLGLAYIAISLDATGLLRYLALHVCLRAGRSGYGLFVLLYAFFFLAGVLVGNDPVILSGTAFLVHFSRAAGLVPPHAWIWAQFVAANVASAVLVSSNPTNLVIASGFGIDFLSYTAYMVLPSLAAALAALPAILLYFRNRPGDAATDEEEDHEHGAVDGPDARHELEAEVMPASPHDSRGNVDPTTTSQARKRAAGGHPGVAEAAEPRSVSSAERAYPATSDPVSHERDIVAPGSQHFLSSLLGRHRAKANGASAARLDNGSGSLRRRSHGRHWRRKSPLIYIPPVLVKPDVHPRSALVDAKGAAFVSFVMAATLVTVVVTSVTGHVKVYMVALPGAALCLARDVVADLTSEWRKHRQERSQGGTSGGQGGQGVMDTHKHEDGVASTSAAPAQPRDDAMEMRENVSKPMASNGDAGMSRATSAATFQPAVPSVPRQTRGAPGRVRRQTQCVADAWRRTRWRLAQLLPTTSTVLARLPLALLPFAFGMFILVQSLVHVGFVDLLAFGLARVCARAGVVGTTFFVSTVGVVLCNFGGTNIGATILLTRALQSSTFRTQLLSAVASRQSTSSVAAKSALTSVVELTTASRTASDAADAAARSTSSLILKAALFSLALGSNLGALGGTFSASLAGLLWRETLRQGNVEVRAARHFLVWCLVVIVPCTAAGALVLWLEVGRFGLVEVSI